MFVAAAHPLSFFLPVYTYGPLLNPPPAWMWAAPLYRPLGVAPAPWLLKVAARLAPSDGRSALSFVVPATILVVLWAAYIALIAVDEQFYGIGLLLGEAAAALATIATVAVWRASKRAPRKPSTVSKGSA